MIAIPATGYDAFDIDACAERGIIVCNVRGYAINTVPEHTFALILALRRSLPGFRQDVIAGKWQEADQFCFFHTRSGWCSQVARCWVSMQDIRTGPPPDNGLEVMYKSASFNDKMLGHGEPVRVREGQRVLFRLLNASPTENITLALPDHRFTVIALDGNPVPSPQSVDTLFLAPAERADVIVEMNRPCVWVLGVIKDEDRKMGLGVVVEYANQRGEAQWSLPPDSQWDYSIFGQDRQVPSPDERLELIFEKVPGGRGGYNRWTINGKSWPNTNPLFTTETGKRYRLAMTNKSGDNHPAIA
jgi:FtsP/CotA-like multicopper oxidase with cupredoxin domain